MSMPFIGQITFFPWNWAPQGWFSCDGSILYIQQYPALYSLIGTVYGGNVQQGTFGLPDLRGRVPVGVGAVSGSTRTWTPGKTEGTEAVLLNNTSYLPAHTHTISMGGVSPGTGMAASGAMLTTVIPNQWFAAPKASANTTLSPMALSSAYDPVQLHENRQPYLVLNPCIAWDGEYPNLGG